MTWDRIARMDCGNGESITIYMSDDRKWKIESRKERVAHTARSGYWMHTTYWLIRTEDRKEKQFWRLMDAKKAAEEGNI